VIHSQTEDEYARLREDLEQHVDAAYEQFANLAEEIDPTLISAIGKQRRHVLDMIGKTEALLVRRKARKEESLHHQIERVKRLLSPLDQPQERVLGIVHFLARYGMELPDQLGKALAGTRFGKHVLLGLS